MRKFSKIITFYSILFLLCMNISSCNTKEQISNVTINNNYVKKLIIGRANDSLSLDPANTTDIDSIRVTVNIFETLVKYEKDGKNIVPNLALSWRVSEDGLVWTFKLRQGVRFHDGTVFNADAVIFNFKRWMDVKNPYHNGKFEYWDYVFNGFPGIVKDVVALNNYCIEIRLNKPYAPLLSTLAMPFFAISSPEAIKKYKEDLSNHPVGTGPFVFKSWDKNKSIVLTKNYDYWGQDAKINEVEFKVIPSDKNRIKELKEGKIHIADDISSDEAIFLKDDSNFRLILRPCFNIAYLALNNEKPPFNDRNVRLSIAHAIDKNKMIEKVYFNFAKPAKTFIPPLLIGYDDEIVEREYNIKKAKEYLRQSKYSKGFNTTLWVMNSPRSYLPKPIETANYIKESLKKINIDVTIKDLNWNEYLYRIKNGEHDMALIGWMGDNIDPDNFLNTFFSSDNAKKGSSSNYSFYKNKKVDELLIQARQNSDLSFRRMQYKRILEIIDYDMPSIPLSHNMPILVSNTKVKGYIPSITGIESLENVDIN